MARAHYMCHRLACASGCKQPFYKRTNQQVGPMLILRHLKLPLMTTIVTLINKRAGAEDQVQRKWHKQLQSVLLWLMPEHSADQHMPNSSQVSAASADTQPHTCQHNTMLRHSPTKAEDTVPVSASASNSMQQNPLSSAHQKGTGNWWL